MDITGINALLKALPISGIRSKIIANVSGLPIYEPPAGQVLPFVNPVRMGSQILQLEQGLERYEAEPLVSKAYSKTRQDLGVLDRPAIYTDKSEECISLPRAAEFLQENEFISSDLHHFLSMVTDSICSTRIYKITNSVVEVLKRLNDMPELLTPAAMMVTLDEIPEPARIDCAGDGWWPDIPMVSFSNWRQSIVTTGTVLDGISGKRVYSHSGTLGDNSRDRLHRWLALHYWCTTFPESAFVSYLCEASGFSNAAMLKEALISPESYDYPYKQQWPYESILCSELTFSWPVKFFGKNKTIGIVVVGPDAKLLAEEIALLRIGSRIVISDPEGTADEEWLSNACRNNRGCVIENDPESLISSIDELHLVAAHDVKDLSSANLLEIRRFALEKGISVHGYISGRGLQPFSLKLSEPLIKMPSHVNRQRRYHRLNNLGVGILWSGEDKSIVFGISAEAKARVDAWIKWADEKAYDDDTGRHRKCKGNDQSI